MSAAALHPWVLAGWALTALVSFLLLWFVSAPYGRHDRRGWGPSMPARLGWLLMELPAVLVPLACAATGTGSPLAWLLLGLWLLHYVDRALIYPFRMRMAGRRMPVLVALLAAGTNVVGNWAIFAWHFGLGPPGALDAAAWPRVAPGVALFLLGFALNRHSDAVLRALRGPGETGYRVPMRGAHRLVACPNYLGELVAWLGFALFAASPPAWMFLLWSAANLVPRARDHLRWYRARFPDYPPERRALLPGIW
jgi:3-oxo-5-alpha-steroid 4-dehydrogenase 1